MSSFKPGFVLLVLTQATLLSAVKDGVCPKAGPFGACVVTCGADEDCDGSKKCCSNGCGAWCVEPMCPPGQEHVNCPAQLCNYVGCPDQPQESLRCVVESCGKCSVKFVNKTSGETVDCGPVESLCKRMLAATQKRPLLLGQYKPSCDANGHFNSIQNHEGYYFCVDERGIPDFSTKSRNNNIKCSELTPCQKKKQEALKLPAIGRFVPECKDDGSFKEKQCHASTGQCWCVDKNGYEFEGTRTRGKLDCTATVCPASSKQLQCDPSLCSTASCPGQKDAKCRVNPCSKCEAEFVNQYGQKVNCYSKCQQQRLEALGTHSLDEKPAHPVAGRFVPQCAADGSYEEIQCYGSTGYCWCVDSEGSPVLGTMVRGLPHCNKSARGVCGGKPMFTCLRNFCEWSSCPAHPDAKCRVNPCGGCKVEFVDKDGNVVNCEKDLTKCQVENAKASTSSRSPQLQPIGRFVPKCEADGSYSQIQCWSSTGYCWCVDENGDEKVGTRVRGRPTCSSGRSKRSVPIKDGFCPIIKEPRTSCPSSKCSADDDCSGMLKCCDVPGCGKTCQEPSFSTCINGTKPFLLCLHMCQFARCPADPQATCFSDPCRMCKVEFRDKQGNVVNCTKGLTPCQARQQLSKGLLGEFVPKCKADGSYEPLQSHEGYSWCVDEDGKEINGTRMRFKQPICGPQALKSNLTLCQLQRLQSVKSGSCPKHQPPACVITCKTDEDCKGSQKCCSNGCGAWCVEPSTPMPGRYIPQCKDDGSFEEVQCHPSTGYCWCVDTEGWEIEGTKIRGIPSCKKTCHPVMCRMYCEYGWAKGPDGCDICKCADAPTKPGFCPAVESGQLGTCIEECSNDNDCHGNRKCCSNGCGHVCTAPEYKAKPGYCPAVETHHVGICKSECSSDRDCRGDQKCCRNGCSRVCSTPVQQACPRGAPLMMCLIDPCERASCPANPKARCRPNYCGQCSAQFFDDNNNLVNCSASVTPCQKEYLEATGGPPGMVGQFIPHCHRDGSYSPLQCHASTGFCWCSTTDGKRIPKTEIRGQPSCSRCKQQAYEATHPPRIGAYIPQCNDDGSYKRLQCWGSTGQCWCVTADGTEVPGTRRRGQPKCDTNEAVVSAFSIESTCDNGKKWQLCKDVCKTATCTKNPDAKCVSPMGGCGSDACQPKFYDSLGKQVQCMTECQQKAYEATRKGLIGAFIPKCNEDGTYARVQCWGSTGYCWCASEDGTEWPGTRVRGQPKCDVNDGPELLSIHAGLTFNYSFDLVRNVSQAFKESLKKQLITMFKLKDDQFQGPEVREGSILVGFTVVPTSGGRDLNEFADDITAKARNHQLVIHFSGLTLVADPEAMLASPMYLEDLRIVNKEQQHESDSSGLSKTGVALVAVVCTLAVVAVALVAYVLIQKKRKTSGDGERAGIVFKDGNAEVNVTLTEA